MTAGGLQAVVIGGSAGSVDAMSTILRALPERYALPIIIVVHLPPDKKSLLPEVLAPHCALPVAEIEDKTEIQGGHVYIAPADYHILVERDGLLSLSAEEEVLFSRPSIDVLFESAADVYGSGLIGIVVTGANEDGAAGLRAVAECGGTCVVQDPMQAYATEMPVAALAAVPTAKVLSLADIGVYLAEVV